MRSFNDAVAEVFQKSQDKLDYTTTYGDFVDSMKPIDQKDFSVVVDGEELVFQKGALKQFVRDRVGGVVSLFNETDVSPATKMAYLQDKISNFQDRGLAVRRTGVNIDAVLSEQYAYFDNQNLMNALVNFAYDGTMPPAQDLYAHTFYTDDAARQVNMRIVAPDHWNFRNGDEYYGGIMFSNNETGVGSLQVRPALARVACFNYTLAESRLNVEHRYADFNEMMEALRKGVSTMNDYSKQMFDKIQLTHNIGFDNPQGVFELAAEKFGFPNAVKESTYDYWQNEGEDSSLFGITQAITWGVQSATDVGGRKKPKWDVRERIETLTTDWMNELIDLHQEGEDVNRWVSEAELIGKSKVLTVLEGNGWDIAAAAIRGMEAEAYT
jgi:hypothetical protein